MYLNLPIEELRREELPECLATSSDQLPFGDGFEDVIEGFDGTIVSNVGDSGLGSGMGALDDASWPLTSPYFAMVVILALIVICGFVVFTR